MRTFIKNLFSRKNNSPKTKSKFNFRQLELTGLEERITPAVFSENSGLITIQLAANESLVGVSANVTTSGSNAVVTINATSTGSNSVGSGSGLVLTSSSVTYTGSAFTGISILGSTGIETVGISGAVNLFDNNPVAASSFAVGSSVETLTVAGAVTTKVGNIGLTAGNISLAADLTTTTSGSITVDGPTTLISNVAIQTGGTLATDDISFTNSVNGANKTLTLTAGAGDVSFTGQLDLTTLSLGIVNNFSSTGSGGTITNAIVFTNTGNLTLGQAGGTQTYGGGLSTVSPNIDLVTLNGTIATTDDAINLGAITLGSATTLKTNSSTTTGDITIGAITGATFNLTLDSGSTSGADISVSSTSDVGTLTIAQSSNATFSGNVGASSLITAAGNYSVVLNGGATITNAVSFLNTGGVTLGNDPTDILAFAGGLTSTASTTTINGTVRTSGNAIQLGAVTLAGNSVLDTTNNGGTVAGSTITTGTVTDGSNAFSLELKAGTSTATFNGNVTIDDLITNATAYSINLLGAVNSFTSQVAFVNTGELTLGTANTDKTTFTGGVTATATRTNFNIAGTIEAPTNQAINLNNSGGLVNVTANTTVGGVGTSGDITLGNVYIDNGMTLIVGAGSSNTNNIVIGSVSGDATCSPASDLTINTNGTANVNGAVGIDIGVVTITKSSGTTFASTVAANTVAIADGTVGTTVAFQDNLTANVMTVAAGTAAYNVSITGSSNSIESATIFNNTGTLTINNSSTDTTNFRSGITATAPTEKKVSGNISATNGGAIDLGTTLVTVENDTTIGNQSSGAAITLGNATIAGGKTLTVGTGNFQTINLGSVSGASAGSPSNLTIRTRNNATVSGTVNTNINVVTVNGGGNDGNLIEFQDNVNITTFNTDSDGFRVAFKGASNSISTATTFNNSGSASSVTFGNDSTDSITFTNGLTVTSPRSISIEGTVATTNTNMILGDTTVNNETPITIDGTSVNPVTLNAGLGTITLAGNISGTSPNDFLKPITSGSGSTLISGTNSAEILVTTGVVTIANLLDQSGGYTVTGGTLRGGLTGKVGYVTATGGTVSPGISTGDITAKMITTDLTLTTGSTLAIELDGTAITDYDNIEVTNAPTLTGSTLSLSSTISPVAGTVFTIINNLSGNPVVGTFSGQTEGSTIIANGKYFQISYVGGTGANDVTLTVLNSPVVTPSIANRALNTPNATTLTITGTGFDATPGNNTVAFTISGGSAFGTVTAATSTSLTVTFSTAPTVTGNLFAVVTTQVGNSGSPVQVANIVAAPTVTLNTINTIANNATLTITGSGFDPVASGNTLVLSSGVGNITSATSTSLTVSFTTLPADGVLTAQVTSFGGSSGTPVQVATIVAAPTVTLSVANQSQIVTSLTITGTGFNPSGPNTVAFTIAGGTAVGTAVATSSTSLTVTFSTQPTVIGDLFAVVTSFGGSSTSVQVATIVAAPTVAFSAASRAINAPTLVITGTGFDTVGTNTVVFDNGAVGTAVATSSTSLTVTFSTQPSFQTLPGVLTAIVNSYGANSASAVQVATIVAAPTVAFNAASRAINAPTLVITGTGFDPSSPGNNLVTFDNGAVGTVTSATSTSLTVTFSTQPTALGSLSARVTSFGGSSGNLEQVATIVATPVVTVNSANRAINAPTLVITGTGFDPSLPGNNLVTFNNGAVGTVTFATSTSLTVTFSTQPTSFGSLTAQVTSFGGISISRQVATIVAAPTVNFNSAIRAINAPTLVITGTGFDPIAANNLVSFDNGAVGTVQSVNAGGTSMVVAFSTQPATYGCLNAVVTSFGGISGNPVEVANLVYPPTVNPNTTVIAINAPTLVITGAGFDTVPGNNLVTFNNGAVGIVTSATFTSLTVAFVTSPNTTGGLTAVVTSFGGISGSPVQVATIVAAPTITPNTSNLLINTPVIVITGTGFDPIAANNFVTFNNGVAGVVTSATPTSLSITFSTVPTITGSLTAVVVSFAGSSGNPVQVANIVNAPPLATGSAPPEAFDSGNFITTVNLYDPVTNEVIGVATPFPGFTGQVRVATGDFNNDGIVEIVAAAGPGGGPAIAILNSATGEILESFFAFDPTFTGGVFVAVKDFNSDGVFDIIAGAGPGGGPEVRIFNGSNLQAIRSFYAYDVNFTGGVRVAVADFNRDGILDLITGAGPGGAPHVKVFDGATNSIISQWYAYSMTFTGGVFVAVGDISNDGSFEVVTGAGQGGAPVVGVWNPFTGENLAQFLAYASDFTGGVRVGVSDATGDGIVDLITGAGPTGGPHVKAFNFPQLDLLFQFYSGESTNPDGVFVT